MVKKKSLSNKKILLLMGIDFFIGLAIILLYVFKVIPEIILTIGIFVVLISASTLSSMLMSRHFQKKMMKKKRGPLYQIKDQLTIKGRIKEFEVNYGKVQFFFEGKNIYNLSIIKNPELFFSEEQEEIKLNIDVNKYQKSIQFFIFDSNREDIYQKISILNYQAKKFCVASFMYNEMEKTLYQTDAITLTEEFEKLYQRFLHLLNMNLKLDE